MIWPIPRSSWPSRTNFFLPRVNLADGLTAFLLDFTTRRDENQQHWGFLLVKDPCSQETLLFIRAEILLPEESFLCRKEV